MMKLKNSLKRMISVLVLVTMCFSGTSVFAEYDVDHSVVIGGNLGAAYPSNTEDLRDKAVYEAGKFTIGGKTFVMLDKDSDGNYFIATADTYGRYKYHQGDMTYNTDPVNGLSQKTTLVTATQSGDTWIIDDSAAKTFVANQKTADWTFSTTNEKSIGYWLNNGFLTNGNGTGNILPDKIQSHLVAKEWGVESIKPLKNVKNTSDATTAINNNASGYMKETDLLGLQLDGYNTAAAKVSLLSYTEYTKYWEKLGCVKNSEHNTVWKNGILLRTPSIRVEWDTTVNGYVMARGAAGIVGQNTLAYNQLGILSFRNASDTMYYVRPVFWLDKDFFVKEESNISGAGAEITAEIQTKKAELAAEFAANPYAVRRRYTDAELNTLGLLTLTDEGYQAVGYPTSSSLAPFDGEYYNTSTDRRKTWKLSTPTSKQAPDDRYAFEFDGKKFLVLDNDGNGNYFVSAYESYGRSPVAYTDKTTLTTGATSDDLSFVFDYENEGSIAYWLDNTFKTNTRYLPEEIAENIKTHTWEIEGIGSCGETNTGSKIDAMSNVIEAYRNADLGAKATTTGGVALISLTEYMKYRNILGHIDTSEAKTDGSNLWVYDVLMRTPMAMVKDDCTVVPGVFIYNRNSYDDTTDKTTKIARSNVASHVNNQLRPVFWLKGDFFRENKIDLTKAGTEVIKILAQLTKDEAIAAGYSANEYNALQGNIPWGVVVTTNLESSDLTDVNSITVTLNNATNVSKSIDVLAIIAIYDKYDELIDIKMQETTLPANCERSTVIFTPSSDVVYDSQTYGRVFVWSSLKDIVPYDKATSFGAK